MEATQTRDAKGEWLPDPLPYPSPLIYGPWKLSGLLKHLWNVIWPYNFFYAALAFFCWLYLTPSLETTANLDHSFESISCDFQPHACRRQPSAGAQRIPRVSHQ